MCNAMVPQHVAPAQAAVFAALGQHPAGTDIAAWDTMLRDCFMRAIGAACANKRWELSGDAGKYSDSFIFCLSALFHILTHLTRHCFLLTMQPLLKQTQCCAVCALHAPASAALLSLLKDSPLLRVLTILVGRSAITFFLTDQPLNQHT